MQAALKSLEDRMKVEMGQPSLPCSNIEICRIELPGLIAQP